MATKRAKSVKLGQCARLEIYPAEVIVSPIGDGQFVVYAAHPNVTELSFDHDPFVQSCVVTVKAKEPEL